METESVDCCGLGLEFGYRESDCTQIKRGYFLVNIGLRYSFSCAGILGPRRRLEMKYHHLYSARSGGRVKIL